MKSSFLDPIQHATPTPHDQAAASQAMRHLKGLFDQSAPIRFEGASVEIPSIAAELLFSLLKNLAAGNAVTIFPIHAELTTQQVADLLGVSRPYIIKQIEEGHLPYRMVGAHRRILFADFMAYKRKSDQARAAALDELSAQGQEFGDYAA